MLAKNASQRVGIFEMSTKIVVSQKNSYFWAQKIKYNKKKKNTEELCSATSNRKHPQPS